MTHPLAYIIVALLVFAGFYVAYRLRERRREEDRVLTQVKYDLRVQPGGTPPRYEEMAPSELLERERYMELATLGLFPIEAGSTRMQRGYLLRDIYTRRTINTYQGQEFLSMRGYHGS